MKIETGNIKKVLRVFTLICFVVLINACSNDDNGSGNGDNPIGDNQDPITGVQLIFPFEDSLCNEGTDVTPTESTVFFEWEPNNNATTYTLTIENLDSGNSLQYQTAQFIYAVTIARANAFRWMVTYDYQEETQESAAWNFYNAGPGILNYAPFPAEIISPSMAESIPATNSVNLDWSGSDVDDDIVGYDVYFGSNINPDLVANDVNVNFLNVSVVPGTIYYWEIVTKDSAGNSSESGLYQFRVSE